MKYPTLYLLKYFIFTPKLFVIINGIRQNPGFFSSFRIKVTIKIFVLWDDAFPRMYLTHLIVVFSCSNSFRGQRKTQKLMNRPKIAIIAEIQNFFFYCKVGFER